MNAFKQNAKRYFDVKKQLEKEGLEMEPSLNDWHRVFHKGEVWKMESRRQSPFSINTKTGERISA